MADSSTWLPIVTLVGGAILGGGTEWLRDRRAWRRGREERNADRAEESRLRRVEFQRETLLALQEALARLGRAEGRMSHEDIVAFKETGFWGENVHSQDASEALGTALRDVNTLASRVNDDVVRAQAQRLGGLVADVAFAKTHAQGLAISSDITSVYRAAIDRAGEVLRGLG